MCSTFDLDNLKVQLLKLQYYFGSEKVRVKMERKKEDIIKNGKLIASEYINDRLIRAGLDLKQRKISEKNWHCFWAKIS